MRSYFLYLIKLISVCLSSLLLLGCANHVLNIDIPPLQTGSPLGEVPSKTFFFNEFEDGRATDEVKQWGAHVYKLGKAAGTIVGDEIKQEFERNGHKCVSASQQSKIDFVVSGKVSMARIRWDRSSLEKTVTNFIVELTVIDSYDKSKREYSKIYESEYRFTGDPSYNGGYDLQGEVFTYLLKRALMQAVIEISTDFDLIAFLEKK